MDSRIEIHFHDQDTASVFYESTESGARAEYAEILSFCALSARQLINLRFGGAQDAADALASAVVALGEAAVGNQPLPDEVSLVKLVTYQGAPGRKRFELPVHFDDQRFRFSLKAKGFGVSAEGIGFYAPMSVIL